MHFIKDKEQQEVDFIIANEGEPLVLIEAKLLDTKPSLAEGSSLLLTLFNFEQGSTVDLTPFLLHFYYH